MTARAIKKQKQNANKDKPATRKKWGGGRKILGGSLDFRENKRGDRWKLLKDSEGGPLKFVWKIKALGRTQKFLRGITSVK